MKPKNTHIYDELPKLKQPKFYPAASGQNVKRFMRSVRAGAWNRDLDISIQCDFERGGIIVSRPQ